MIAILLLLLPSANAYLTNAKMPVCMDGPDEIQIDNRRVLDLKHSTKNQYHDRGFVQGTIVDGSSQRNDHDHFVIQIGPNRSDTIEIVYNRVFGAMPSFQTGDPIVVCGDYITSNAKGGGYDASPEGAIIHWVHFNPGTRESSARHEHGFLMFGTNLAGFDDAPVGDWSGRIIKAPQPDGNGPESKESPVPAEFRRNSDPSRGGPVRSHPSQNSRPCRTLDECRARNGG